MKKYVSFAMHTLRLLDKFVYIAKGGVVGA